MENNKLDQVKLFVNQNRTNVIIGIIALVVILIAAVLIINKKMNKEEVAAVEGCKAGDLFSQTTGKPCFTSELLEACKAGDLYNINTGEPCNEDVKKDTSNNTNKGTLGYAEALKEYAGKSLSFNASCVSTPAVLEAAKGSMILISNDSNVALEISVQGRTKNLSPYHYMLSTLGAAGEISVSCNGSNAAKVVAK